MNIWSTFNYTNLNFILEMAMAIISLSAGFLHLDALRAKYSFVYLARGIGFFFVVPAMVVDALSFQNALISDISMALVTLGLIFLMISFFIHKSPKLPKTPKIPKIPQTMVVVPFALSSLLSLHERYYPLILLMFVILFLGNFLIRLFLNIEKQLKPYLYAVLFIIISRYFIFLHSDGTFDIFWTLDIFSRLIAFSFLANYVIRYLSFRYKEQLFLTYSIFLLIFSTIATVTFSYLLFGLLVKNKVAELSTDVKLLDFGLERSRDQILSNAQLLSEDEQLARAIAIGNEKGYESITTKFVAKRRVDFALVTNADGKVLYRTYLPNTKGDNLSSTPLIKASLQGKDVLDYTYLDEMESSFAQVASVPIYYTGKISGTVSVGFFLDNNFVTDFKEETGLEATIFAGQTRVATTLQHIGGTIYAVNTREANPIVLERVLLKGEDFATDEIILSRSSFAAYRPIKNIEGRPVGMLQVSSLQVDIFTAFNNLNQISFGISLMLFSILLMPLYLVSRGILRKEAQFEI